jgi:hypothetical protein
MCGIDKERREFRITRPEAYPNPDTPGHKDPSARQGYYVHATDAENAKEVFRDMVAKDRQRFAGVETTERFDVQDWQ